MILRRLLPPLLLLFAPACFEPSAPASMPVDVSTSSLTATEQRDTTGGATTTGDGPTSSTTDGGSTDTGSSSSGEPTDGDVESSTGGESSTGTETICGDGEIDEDEQCDDANDLDDDGCSACAIEYGFWCAGEPTVCSSVPCDPLVQDCGRGGCFPFGEQWACTPSTSEGEGQQGDPCDTLSDCTPGRACVSATGYPNCDTPSCCARICDLTAPVCGSQFDCTAWYAVGQAPPGYESVGVCV